MAKSLMFSGVALIRTSPPFTSPHSRDAWPAHAAHGVIFDWSVCASGARVIWFEFQLLSLDTFYYPCAFVDDDVQAAAFIDYFSNSPFGNVPPECFGLQFNYILRPRVFDKVLSSDWSLWLATH